MIHPITVSSRGYTSKYRVHLYNIMYNGQVATLHTNQLSLHDGTRCVSGMGNYSI
jgi:hypothetical protein